MREIEADPAAKVAWDVQQAASRVRKAAKAAQDTEQVQPSTMAFSRISCKFVTPKQK